MKIEDEINDDNDGILIFIYFNPILLKNLLKILLKMALNLLMNLFSKIANELK